MIVTCPGCNSNYRVRNEAVPSQGARMKCPTCATMFLAKRPANAEPAPVTGLGDEVHAATPAPVPVPAPVEAPSPAAPTSTQMAFPAVPAPASSDPFAGLGPGLSPPPPPPATEPPAPAAPAGGTLQAFPAVNPGSTTPPAAPVGATASWDPFAPPPSSATTPPTSGGPPIPAPSNAAAGGPAATFLSFPAVPPAGSPPAGAPPAGSAQKTQMAFPAVPAPAAPSPGQDPFAPPQPPQPGNPAASNPAATLQAFPAVNPSAVTPPAAPPETEPPQPSPGAEAPLSDASSVDDILMNNGADPFGGSSDDPFGEGAEGPSGLALDGDNLSLDASPADGGIDLPQAGGRETFGDDDDVVADGASDGALDIRDDESRARIDLPPPVIDYGPSPAPAGPSTGAVVTSWIMAVVGGLTLVTGIVVALWGFGIANLDDVIVPPLESTFSVTPAKSYLGKDSAPVASLVDDAKAAAVRGDSESELLIWKQVLAREPEHAAAKPRHQELSERLHVQR